jgi:glycosyltransferase involved in cell wall biosynthesis
MVKALNDKFSHSFDISICALESDEYSYKYPSEVKYILKTSIPGAYAPIAEKINLDPTICLVYIQHEFGFFYQQEESLIQFLKSLQKPVSVAFHTVLPLPDEKRKIHINNIAAYSQQVVVMTKNSANLLINTYNVPAEKITEIAHGTHLVPHKTKKSLKIKYDLKYRKVLSTFGLLSSGKGIETTIEALPAIVEKIPEVMFLVLGKTHPEVIKQEGEKYRNSLEQKVKDYKLENNVRFINRYLSLADLLEYLQLTDVYLFTSLDPNQAVSGTFVYAMSCAAPIISTPIPHAKELLAKDTGIIVDFRNPTQLAREVIHLLGNEPLRKSLSINTLHKTVATAWENSAIKHAIMFAQMANKGFDISYNLPEISLQHLYRMTNDVGIVQFAKLNLPDIKTGYTLDDNARAMVATCMIYQHKGKAKDLDLIREYLEFISMCQQSGGNFLNYVDKELQFTTQNDEVNLDDSNGRAIWALGYLASMNKVLPSDITEKADKIISRSLVHILSMYSTRAMAFSIKGLYYYYQKKNAQGIKSVLKMLAHRIMLMYKFESGKGWNWFESYLTYANSIIPEAMLYAWLVTENEEYKKIAYESFDFLLSKTFNEQGIEVISNRGWLNKGHTPEKYGEQPIDVAYTIMTLSLFYDVSHDESYRQKLITAFNWFLGHNRLNQIVYNPVTGGCYDGLEETHVNLNQGAESLASYLMARLIMERYS